MSRLEQFDLFKADSKMDFSAPTNMPVAFWNRKVERPSYEILTHEIENLGYTGTGRKYGVSDNTVRKWVKAYRQKRQAEVIVKPGRNQAGKSPTQAPAKNKRVNRRNG